MPHAGDNLAVLAQVVPIGIDVAAVAAWVASGLVVLVGLLIGIIWTALVKRVSALERKQHKLNGAITALLISTRTRTPSDDTDSGDEPE